MINDFINAIRKKTGAAPSSGNYSKGHTANIDLILEAHSGDAWSSDRVGRESKSIYPIADEIKQHFGFIVVDECHHTPSRTFTEAVSTFDCQ